MLLAVSVALGSLVLLQVWSPPHPTCTCITSTLTRMQACKRLYKRTCRCTSILADITKAIGQTPLVRIKSLSELTGCEVRTRCMPSAIALSPSLFRHHHPLSIAVSCATSTSQHHLEFNIMFMSYPIQCTPLVHCLCTATFMPTLNLLDARNQPSPLCPAMTWMLPHGTSPGS
jgi:hypothetical protein